MMTLSLEEMVVLGNATNWVSKSDLANWAFLNLKQYAMSDMTYYTIIDKLRKRRLLDKDEATQKLIVSNLGSHLFKENVSEFRELTEQFQNIALKL